MQKPGSLSILETGPEDVEGRQKARRITRASGQIAEFHSTTFVAHVNDGRPGCMK